MHQPALAIGWQFWRHYRWGLSAISIYLLALALLVAVLPAEWQSRVLAGIATVPLALALVFLFGVFSFGLEVDISARQSGFPARMFALPVPGWALAAWPMLFGTAAVAAGWIVLAAFVLRPCGYDAWLWLPAVVFAALVAWLQALAWTPFGLALVRSFLIVAFLGALISAAIVAATFGAGELPLTAALGLALPAAYLVAWRGVARARRGDGAAWQWPAKVQHCAATLLPRRQRSFATAADAQLWYEWRRSAMVFPFFMGCILLFAAPLVLKDNLQITSPFMLLAVLFALPPLIAGIHGGNLGKWDYWVRPGQLSSFIATRPVSCAALVAAKFRAAATSTAIVWMMVLVVAALWLVPEGRYELAAGLWRRVFAQYPSWAAWMVTLVALLGCMACTWRQLVGGLSIGLSGRKWIANLATAAGMLALIALIAMAIWIDRHPQHLDTLLRFAAWLAGAAVVAKLLAGWALLKALSHRMLLEPGTLLGWIAGWCLLALYLFVMLALAVPAELLPRRYLVLGILLLMPLNSLALAPLALAWNRHR